MSHTVQINPLGKRVDGAGDESQAIGPGHPLQYATAWEFDVVLQGPEGPLLRVGDLSLIEVDLNGWVRDGRQCDLSETFTAYDIAEIGHALFEGNQEYRAGLATAGDTRLLILEHLRVSEFAQGRGVGTDVVRWVQEHCRTGYDLVALSAWPINEVQKLRVRLHEEHGRVDEQTEQAAQESVEFRKKVERVRNFYLRCGFVPLEGRVMYWSPAMAGKPCTGKKA